MMNNFTPILVAIWVHLIQDPSTPEEQLRLKLQALNEVVREESGKLAGQCDDAMVAERLGRPNREMARQALEVASLQRQRVARMKEHPQITRNESIAAELKGIEYLLTAFSCDPSRSEHLDLARVMIDDARIQIDRNEDKSISVDSDRHKEFASTSERASALQRRVETARSPAPARADVVPIDPDRQRLAEFRVPPASQPSPPTKRTREFDRISLRIELGYSAGRLSRSASHKIPTHNGMYTQVSLHVRFPFERGALSFGPYYGYWRAIDRTTDRGLVDMNAHWMGARLETGINLWRQNVTLHPALELGIEYGKFDTRVRYPPAAKGVASDIDEFEFHWFFRDFVGLSVGGGVSLCALSATVCFGLRLKSVPSQLSIPTTQVGLGFDILRLASWTMREKR